MKDEAQASPEGKPTPPTMRRELQIQAVMRNWQRVEAVMEAIADGKYPDAETLRRTRHAMADAMEITAQLLSEADDEWEGDGPEAEEWERGDAGF